MYRSVLMPSRATCALSQLQVCQGSNQVLAVHSLASPTGALRPAADTQKHRQALSFVAYLRSRCRPCWPDFNWWSGQCMPCGTAELQLEVKPTRSRPEAPHALPNACST